MSSREEIKRTRMRILAVSARLLLARGYRATTIRSIAEGADVSVSSVQNFFHSKEGILAELVQVMFDGQFGAARGAVPQELPPVYTYAVETAIQLALTERDERLRELYTEAYAMPEPAERIHRNTSAELARIFGDRFPGYDERAFYEMEIGSAGLMRAYMAKPCSDEFPLQRKLERFLRASLRIYRVGEEEQDRVLAYIGTLDLGAAADGVMQEILAGLEQHFDLKRLQRRTARTR